MTVTVESGIDETVTKSKKSQNTMVTKYLVLSFQGQQGGQPARPERRCSGLGGRGGRQERVSRDGDRGRQPRPGLHLARLLAPRLGQGGAPGQEV